MTAIGVIIIIFESLTALFIMAFGAIVHIRTMNLINYVNKRSRMKKSQLKELQFTSRLKLTGLLEVLMVSVLSTVLCIQCGLNGRPLWTMILTGSSAIILSVGCLLYLLYTNNDIKRAKTYVIKQVKKERSKEREGLAVKADSFRKRVPIIEVDFQTSNVIN